MNNDNLYNKNSDINNLNNDSFINNIKTQKLLTYANKKNKYVKLRDKFITTSNCVIKEIINIKNKRNKIITLRNEYKEIRKKN